jgi:hypothetical protein
MMTIALLIRASPGPLAGRVIAFNYFRRPERSEAKSRDLFSRRRPHETAPDAIAREKQLKNWSRGKKIALINLANPDWRDLSGEIHDYG